MRALDLLPGCDVAMPLPDFIPDMLKSRNVVAASSGPIWVVVVKSQHTTALTCSVSTSLPLFLASRASLTWSTRISKALTTRRCPSEEDSFEPFLLPIPRAGSDRRFPLKIKGLGPFKMPNFVEVWLQGNVQVKTSWGVQEVCRLREILRRCMRMAVRILAHCTQRRACNDSPFHFMKQLTRIAALSFLPTLANLCSRSKTRWERSRECDPRSAASSCCISWHCFLHANTSCANSFERSSACLVLSCSATICIRQASPCHDTWLKSFWVRSCKCLASSFAPLLSSACLLISSACVARSAMRISSNSWQRLISISSFRSARRARLPKSTIRAISSFATFNCFSSTSFRCVRSFISSCLLNRIALYCSSCASADFNCNLDPSRSVSTCRSRSCCCLNSALIVSNW